MEVLARDYIPIHHLDDPRVAVYRDLKDRELARLERRFIAESEHVVRRLLESNYPIESVLVCERRAAEMGTVVPPAVPFYVVPDPVIHQIVGYKFHSGVIACGQRKADVTIDQVLPPRDRPSTVLICDEISNNENLGSLIRIASGFGADAMILGERCCDAFYRMTIRVSMGTVFNIPLARSNDLVGDLRRLQREFGYEVAATVLDPAAEPLERAARGPRLGVVFGNEAQGLPSEVAAACDRRVTIPMQRGTDSFNVAVAAGIFMYHFTRAVGTRLVPSPGTPGEG